MDAKVYPYSQHQGKFEKKRSLGICNMERKGMFSLLPLSGKHVFRRRTTARAVNVKMVAIPRK